MPWVTEAIRVNPSESKLSDESDWAKMGHGATCGRGRLVAKSGVVSHMGGGYTCVSHGHDFDTRILFRRREVLRIERGKPAVLIS